MSYPDFNKLFEVNEFDPDCIHEFAVEVERTGQSALKPELQANDPEGYYFNCWSLKHDLRLIETDAPLFMGFEDYTEVYHALKSAGVIKEQDLIYLDPECGISSCSMSLDFKTQAACRQFVERLNQFLHLKRAKLQEFLMAGLNPA